MDITFNCTNCGQSLVADETGAGITIDCPKCGKPVYVPNAVSKAPPPAAAPMVSLRPATATSPLSEPPRARRSNQQLPAAQQVVLTDDDIPFGRLVRLIIKLMLASIPAYLLVLGIFFVVWAVFALLGFGLMSSLMFRIGS